MTSVPMVLRHSTTPPAVSQSFRVVRAIVLCCLCINSVSLNTSAAELPNIVVFISDDLGRLETSIHGSTEVQTPTMDRLAVAGMTFDNAYVGSPSCCPNRFSLLTGLMPARHGAHSNHSRPKPGTKFLPPILKTLGYHVASFGKVHHGRNKIPGVDFNSLSPRNMCENVRQYCASHDIQQPACLMVGDRRPHVAWTSDSVYDPQTVTLPSWLIDTPETREHWARYLTDISGMDAELGRVYDFAKAKFGDNVIFVFTSDHGAQWPFGKWNLYDSGTRIPLVVTWPGRIKPGVRSDAMVSWVDILPTLIDLAQIDLPKDQTDDKLTETRRPQNIDGRSFAKVLLGQTGTHRQKIFTTHTGDGVMNIFPIRSVRVRNYKYIHNLRPNAYHTNHSDRLRKDGAGAYWDSWDELAKTDSKAASIIKRYYTRDEFELFDLEQDPHELTNLAGESTHTQTLQQLRQDLADWTKSQGDDLKPHKDTYPNSKPLPDLRQKRK